MDAFNAGRERTLLPMGLYTYRSSYAAPLSECDLGTRVTLLLQRLACKVGRDGEGQAFSRFAGERSRYHSIEPRKVYGNRI